MAGEILLVDDHNDTLRLLELILARSGFSVLKAENAYRALDILGSSMPDLIITDVMMPGMNGIELCRQVCSDPRTAHIPVVILSAYGDKRSVKQGFAAGASDYLTKPILPYTLLTKIHNILGEGDKNPAPMAEQMIRPPENGQWDRPVS